ncbi:MAG: hypothetical protein NVS3B5_04070 [Sphingomicrobium sp.]
MPARILTEPDDRRIALPDVTLVAVSDIALGATARALAVSQAGLRFAEVLLLSSQDSPSGLEANLCPIAPIGSREAYSRFMVQSLHRHIETSHALSVQWDGYVLDPARWDPEFLEYDYVGAPWPHFDGPMRVGNGGFSLRSRRLLEACATLDIGDEAEDVAICRTHRPMLERRFGLRFAPEGLAGRFAFERAAPRGDEFGFHGAFNMTRLVPGRELAELLADLEPGLLNRREHREILLQALRRGDLRLARVLWHRLRHPAARRR